ncbi:MAG TPA: hypothetical protein VKE51_22805 [Vicinamibacterales bacterium]|nr:hypothetical protein [Vicinamibacterales bacterium]
MGDPALTGGGDVAAPLLLTPSDINNDAAHDGDGQRGRAGDRFRWSPINRSIIS